VTLEIGDTVFVRCRVVVGPGGNPFLRPITSQGRLLGKSDRPRQSGPVDPPFHTPLNPHCIEQLKPEFLVTVTELKALFKTLEEFKEKS
jgi:hypothetical protein